MVMSLESRTAHPNAVKDVGLMDIPVSGIVIGPLPNTQLLEPPDCTVRTNVEPVQQEKLNIEYKQ
jgi:hypothetical protein